MSKHTKGPWHVEPQQDGASWEICTEKRGAWIMLLRSTAEATEEERAEDAANAQLMASAPELLEALQNAVAYLKPRVVGGVAGVELLPSLLVAIAKATKATP